VLREDNGRLFKKPKKVGHQQGAQQYVHVDQVRKGKASTVLPPAVKKSLHIPQRIAGTGNDSSTPVDIIDEKSLDTLSFKEIVFKSLIRRNASLGVNHRHFAMRCNGFCLLTDKNPQLWIIPVGIPAWQKKDLYLFFPIHNSLFSRLRD
jgi:hypothetical protein